ncbi:MAG: ATP-grasp domain-containing protein [Candidatus Rokubacteria bacterium]|nr:ATP-grasp domain-containing protein [Candidatus Rokubacteria bacterium]
MDRRELPWQKVDHSNHAYDPRDREPQFSVIVNRTSPSSHTRGHPGVLFYAEPLLAHFEALGIPVINPVAAYRFEKSKALQAGLFEQLGVRYPRAIVVNHRGRIPAAAASLRFPIVVKPNVGGSGAGITRFDSPQDLETRLASLDLGPDGTALVQEYVEPRDGAIVRVEVLDGRYLYAIRIVRRTDQFNLCPADICRTPAPDAANALAACPVDTPSLEVARTEPPAEAVAAAIRLTRAASIDVGGVEYLVGKHDGRMYFYDVNATSNFVANAPEVLGFDPFVPFVDFIQSCVGPRNGPPHPPTLRTSRGTRDARREPASPRA